MTARRARCLFPLVLALSSVVRAAEPTAEADKLDALFAAQEMERAPLPQRVESLQVEALRARIVLRPVGAPHPAAEWSKRMRLCPDAEIEGHSVVLHCHTGRIEAELIDRKGVPYIDVRELRGLPWRAADDAMPLLAYDPADIGLGDTCPGTTEAGKGECLLAAGKNDEAAEAFRHAVAETVAMPFASMRLGDIALAAGERAEALRWYRHVPPSGPWGRLSTARVCVLTGNCLGTSGEGATFETVGFVDPLRTEMELMYARALLLSDHVDQAAGLLTDRLQETGRPPACAHAMKLCAAMTLATLEKLPVAKGAPALQLYLVLPDRATAPNAAAMALAAAHISEAAGAPHFAANLLAAATPSVPKAELGHYLYETARLFIAAGDKARAQVAIDFAKEELGASVLRRAEWRVLVPPPVRPAKLSKQNPPSDKASEPLDVSQDTARAAEVLSAARARHEN